MKKQYISPELDIIKLEQKNALLVVSGEIEGEATEPASAREVSDLDYMLEF